MNGESERYNIGIKSSALKELKKLPDSIKSRIHASILALADNPYRKGVRKLVQYKDMYRTRIGNYRILFRIDDTQRSIKIFEIKHRKDAYQ